MLGSIGMTVWEFGLTCREFGNDMPGVKGKSAGSYAVGTSEVLQTCSQ